MVFRKGQVPWNKDLKGFRKGIPRHSYNDEFKKKISESSKGRIPWNKDLTKQDDLRLEKISFSMTYKNPMKNIEVKKKVSMTARGLSEKEWEGFSNYKINRKAKHLTFRRIILHRDNNTCVCGKPGNIVHHIDYDNFNDIPKNTITVCRKCHTKTNWNREYWKSFFSEYLLNRNKGGQEWERQVNQDIQLLQI